MALIVLALALSAAAQMRMSVQQLSSFIRSSLEMNYEDKKIAEYLKQVQLNERLSAALLIELKAAGAGPKTVEQLERLQEASKALPAPAPPPAEKPKVEIPPPSPEEQRKLIAALRDYAANYTSRLPDFICTQVIRRYYDPTGLEFWRREDVVTVRLSYFEQKEDYKVVLVNSRPVETSYDQLGGATSMGEFGTMLKEIVDPETKADFRWARWATFRGRRMHVVEYRVSQERSKWSISWQKQLSTVPAYNGLLYMDSTDGSVARMTLTATGIPPSFPIQEASTVLDYDMVDIAGRNYMLPLKYVMRMREGRVLVKNEVEFRLYRKFGAEATITFDTPEPLPDEQPKDIQPPR